MPSPYFPELTFMGLRGYNSVVFRAPHFIVSPVGKGERRRGRKRLKKEKGRKENDIEKECKEGRKNEE